MGEKKSTVEKILLLIGVFSAIGAAGYKIYQHFFVDEDDEFDDDFDDDFDDLDDDDDDDDDAAEVTTEEAASADQNGNIAKSADDTIFAE